MSCRHGWIWRALNLFVGETYRHVLYLHEYACQKNGLFFCYDVICQYWPFVKRIANNPEFGGRFERLIKDTRDFLSRWHGQTHTWYCQVWQGTLFCKIYVLPLTTLSFDRFSTLDALKLEQLQPLERCRSRSILTFLDIVVQLNIWASRVRDIFFVNHHYIKSLTIILQAESIRFHQLLSNGIKTKFNTWCN